MVATMGYLFSICPEDGNAEFEDIIENTFADIMDQVTSRMDKSVDPCDDFYTYSCGKWMKETTLESDEYRKTLSFDNVAEKTKSVLEDILENDWPYISTYYKSCMDIDSIEKKGTKHVQEILDIVDSTPLTLNDLASLSVDLRRNYSLDVNPFFGVFVDIDSFDSTKYVANVWQNGFVLPDKTYYDPDFDDISDYVTWMKDMFRMASIATDDASAEEIVNRIVDAEVILASISYDSFDNRDPYLLYNPVPLTMTKVLFDEYTTTYLTSFLEAFIPSDDDVIISQYEYILQLKDYIDDEITTETIRDIIKFRVLLQTFEFMGVGYYDTLYGLDEIIYGANESIPRNEYCASMTKSMFPMLLGHYYIQENFDCDSKDIANDIVEQIQHTMNDLLYDNTWMDSETRSFALDKLIYMAENIAYPDTWDDIGLLFSEYDFKIGTDYYANSFGMFNVYDTYSFDSLVNQVDKSVWLDSPATVNAWYSPNFNRITIPAAILQSPFFDTSNPMSHNYGGIGTVIGHEITHGFDDQGSQFDYAGNLDNWWSDTSFEKFYESSQCISDLYSNFEVQKGVYLDGGLTLGENIADVGGVKLAYNAFVSWIHEYETDSTREEESIKYHYGFTNKEMFFISYAQLWCEIKTEEYELVAVKTDPHSPGKYRVKGVLSNFDEFSKTFNCPMGSEYNNEEKCEIW